MKVSGEEKINELRKIIEKLNLPISIDRTTLITSRYAVIFQGKPIAHLNPGKSSLEKLTAETIYSFFSKVHKNLGRRLTKEFDEHSYYMLGYLGCTIRSEYREETERTPKWLKKLESPYGYLSNRGFHVDHVFFSREGGYVSEPYNMTMRDFKCLIDFCDEHNLEFFVKGHSKHFPGHTFRVVITPKVTRRRIKASSSSH